MKNWVTESATNFNKAVARLRKTRPRPDEDAYAYVENLIKAAESDDENDTVSLDILLHLLTYIVALQGYRPWTEKKKGR